MSGGRSRRGKSFEVDVETTSQHQIGGDTSFCEHGHVVSSGNAAEKMSSLSREKSTTGTESRKSLKAGRVTSTKPKIEMKCKKIQRAEDIQQQVEGVRKAARNR